MKLLEEIQERMKKTNRDEEKFGWSNAFKEYTCKDLFLDALFPLIGGSVFLVCLIIFNIDVYAAIVYSCSLNMQVLPSLLGMLLAAYAILITVFFSQFGKEVKELDGGADLLRQINASFAISIAILIIPLIITMLVSFFANFKINEIITDSSDFINSAVFILLWSVVFFAMKIVLDLTINIYNIAFAYLK